MVEILIEYEGGLHCSAQHGPSKTRISTDAPVDNQGRGESFSPTDLFATSLGTCMMTIMAIYAQKHGVDLKGTKVRVEKHMKENPRRIGRLVVEMTIPASLDENRKRALEAAALSCPVHKSLHPEIEVISRFNYSSE